MPEVIKEEASKLVHTVFNSQRPSGAGGRKSISPGLLLLQHPGGPASSSIEVLGQQVVKGFCSALQVKLSKLSSKIIPYRSTQIKPYCWINSSIRDVCLVNKTYRAEQRMMSQTHHLANQIPNPCTMPMFSRKTFTASWYNPFFNTDRNTGERRHKKNPRQLAGGGRG